MYIPFKEIAKDSRLWVFITDRKFTTEDEVDFKLQLEKFLNSWTAHKLELKTSSEIIDGMVICVAVDESMAGASGCSIDKLHHFIIEFQKASNILLLDRMRVVFRNQFGVLVNAKLDDFIEKVKVGEITKDTLVINAQAISLEQPIEIKASETWLAKYFV
jgi:hypothetical protein